MKLYLIDDDHISNFVTEMELSNEPFEKEISSYTSAEDAFASLLQAIPDQLPDIIFLDLNMPGMNGWEFLDALEPHKQHLLPKCRVYILTSSLDIADTARSEDYELVYGLIHKPLGRVDIQAILYDINNEKLR